VLLPSRSTGSTRIVPFSNTPVGIVLPTVAIFTVGGTVLSAFESAINASVAIVDDVALSIGGPVESIDAETIGLGSAGAVILGSHGTRTVAFSTMVSTAKSASTTVFSAGSPSLSHTTSAIDLSSSDILVATSSPVATISRKKSVATRTWRKGWRNLVLLWVPITWAALTMCGTIFQLEELLVNLTA
jgi:hypothetical protein